MKISDGTQSEQVATYTTVTYPVKICTRDDGTELRAAVHDDRLVITYGGADSSGLSVPSDALADLIAVLQAVTA